MLIVEPAKLEETAAQTKDAAQTQGKQLIDRTDAKEESQTKSPTRASNRSRRQTRFFGSPLRQAIKSICWRQSQ